MANTAAAEDVANTLTVSDSKITQKDVHEWLLFLYERFRTALAILSMPLLLYLLDRRSGAVMHEPQEVSHR